MKPTILAASSLTLLFGSHAQELSNVSVITDDTAFYGQSPPFFPSPEASGAGGWIEHVVKAQRLVAQMTLEEKVNLTGGMDNYAASSCGGTIQALLRLGFPGMCLADGPAGVRGSDFVNGYPAGIHVGSSWNRALAHTRGAGIGGEFYRKGITVALAPAVIGPLGRIAEGGRNWEGFSNDPYLAGTLAADTVRGTQEQGIISTTKHFIGNEQEINRNRLSPTDAASFDNRTIEALSSNIDDKTMHELYMWPFYDTIKAGTSSIMCSYVRLNNSYACHNSHALNGLLKTELGFQGFVISDWFAQHSGIASALGGLDMVMPFGETYWGSHLVEAVVNGSVPESRVDDMVTRILAAWYHAHQDAKSTPPVGIGMPPKYIVPHDGIDARNPADDNTLYQGAVEGHVLVKNVNNALPLRKPKVISIHGYDARPISVYTPTANSRGVWPQGLDSYQTFICGFGDELDSTCPPFPPIQFNGTMWTGGGSGAATGSYLISPFEAITERARYDRTMVTWDFETYNGKTTVHSQSEVCLVFLNAAASEGVDRPGLRDNFSDSIVQSVASQCNNTIVVIHNAGVRLVDQWIDHPNVTAAIFAHLPGQDSGRALADILYGDVSPSGKLPYTVAHNESDYRDLLSPSVESRESVHRYFPQDDFAEGVYIDYRAFDRDGISPRYEFGFGLTYTTFNYSNLSIARLASEKLEPHPSGTVLPGGHADLWDIAFRTTAQVSNSGDVEAAEIAQLYLGIPCGEQPVRQLRGYDKQTIAPGQSVQVEFDLRRRDLSVWNVTAQKWELCDGEYQVHVGASSRNLPLIGTLTVN